MEILISVSLVLIIMTIGVKSYDYFNATAKLAESREMLDNLLVKTNVNALTGKSVVSDYYGYDNSLNYQPSRYFLYIKKTNDWDADNVVIYGELQKGIRRFKTIGGKDIMDRDYSKDVYELLYVEPTKISYPVFISNISFTENDGAEEEIGDELFLFFDPPFGNVSFMGDEDIKVHTYTGSDFPFYKELADITPADYESELYLVMEGKSEEKGRVEFALQFKDRTDPDGDDYLLREYVEYDSRNELSHYWD